MLKRSLLFVFLIFSLYSFSQSEYSRIKIFLDGKSIRELQKCDIELNYINRDEGWAMAELSSKEIKLVDNQGFRYEVLIPDLQKYYADRNHSSGSKNNIQKSSMSISGEWPVPANFTLGSYSGFLTVDEMLEQLDLMKSMYPNLITSKQLVSDTLATIEGRPMYYVRISDNPEVAENEPQVLYTGMHHAREPIGMQHLMYYMWYLLENYATNQEVRDLVDNTEMYFIPIVNVDGYSYNINQIPAGGGMWRKNRRNSGGGVFGVDINRNYGFMWGFDDEGSSPDPSSELYRGVSAFSEPETRMLKYFCEGHNFGIALNYHSYSNLLLYSWGWTAIPTSDASLFSAYSNILTSENNYTFGAGNTTIYPTNGGSDDWMYGEQAAKPKILSFTPEVGGPNDGFWPDQDRIIPLCQENMYASYTAARLVGKYGTIADASPFFLWQESGYLQFDVKRLGLQQADYTVSVEPISNCFSSIGAPVIINGLDLLEKRSDSIAYQLAAGLQVGDTIQYVLLLNNGMYSVRDTITRIYGYPYPLFTDRLNDDENWTGSWGLTLESFFSPPSSMTDSPSGNYGSYTFSNTTLNTTVEIIPSLLTVLEFRSHWALEGGFDFVQLTLSDDNGFTWTPLAGKYSRTGTIYQAEGEPVYDGVKADWLREDISLNDWRGKSVKIAFTLVSDYNNHLDGFYFDDVVINSLLDPTIIEEASPEDFWVGLPTPNPASDLVKMNYRVPQSGPAATLKILSTTGNEIYRDNVDVNLQSLAFSVAHYPAGIYFVRLEVPDRPAIVKKIFVKR